MTTNFQKHVFTLSLLVSPAWADTTGAGDAAILSELSVHTAKLKEMIVNMKDTLNVQKHMEEMNELRTVHTIVREGQEVGKIVTDIGDIDQYINEMANNPGGLNQTDSDIAQFKDQMDNASQEKGLTKARSYGYVMTDLQRLKFLGTANRETMKKMGTGTNETDDTKSIATNAMIMSDIAVENEKRETRRRGNDVNALQELMGGSKYSSMVPQEK